MAFGYNLGVGIGKFMCYMIWLISLLSLFGNLVSDSSFIRDPLATGEEGRGRAVSQRPAAMAE